MTNQESEMETLEDLPRDHGRVARLGRRVVRERRALRRAVKIDNHTGIARFYAGLWVALVVGANAAFDLLQRWSKMGFLLLRWNNVVGDVLDEDAFALRWVSSGF